MSDSQEDLGQWHKCKDEFYIFILFLSLLFFWVIDIIFTFCQYYYIIVSSLRGTQTSYLRNGG